MPLLKDRKLMSIHRKGGHGNILSSSNTELDAGSELPAINWDDLSRDSRLKSLEKNFQLHHFKKIP